MGQAVHCFVPDNEPGTSEQPDDQVCLMHTVTVHSIKCCFE
jgi:hypothetical protein